MAIVGEEGTAEFEHLIGNPICAILNRNRRLSQKSYKMWKTENVVRENTRLNEQKLFCYISNNAFKVVYK